MACKADIQEQIVVVPEGEDWQNGLSITDRHKKLFLNERMSDVTFYVGLVEDAEEQKSISLNRLNRIPAHKTILGASSSVFEKMFFGPMAKQQPNQSEVKVLDMEPETFITMLRFVYSEELEVELEYLAQTLYAAKKYMYPKLASAVVDRIIEQIKEENVLEMFEQVEKFEFEKLNLYLMSKIQLKTTSLLENDSFLNIRKSTLEFILSQPMLNVTEPELLDACVRWARAECGRNGIADPRPDQLRKSLGDVVYLIRIHCFSTKVFLAKSSIFTSDEIVQVILNLESIKDSKNDFISKFNQSARSSCQGGWTKLHVYFTEDYETSLESITSGIDLFIEDLVYLHAIKLEKPNCRAGQITNLSVEQDSQVLYLQKKAISDNNFTLRFDRPIPILSGKFSILATFYCQCNAAYSQPSRKINLSTGRNKTIPCTFSFGRMPWCMSSVSLHLF